jgi:hypothetical protein
MIMDGDTVNVGDKVYDVFYGDGTVSELLVDNRARVIFRTKPYGLVFGDNGVGVRYTQRTLYWHDPILMAPPKNVRLWLFLRPVIIKLVSDARTHFGGF